MAGSRDDTAALERRHDELVILFETIRDVTSTLDVGEVLERLLERVLRHVGAEAGAVLVRGPDDALRLGASAGASIADDEVAARVVRTREPENLASGLCVPLEHRDAVLGTLHVRRDEAAEPFGPADLALVRAMAGHAAVALANAQRYEALLERARRDSLTGLANHGYFRTLLEREWERADRYGRRLSLVMFDVDHFKRANDRAGHTAGDRALREIGAILRQNARAADTPARYGGDEFAVLLPETSLDGAAAFAEKVRQVVETARLGPDPEHPLRVSAGVATGPGPARDATGLVEAADRELYRAKSSGRNRVSAARADGVESRA